jgi:hypothetical protein
VGDGGDHHVCAVFEQRVEIGVGGHIQGLREFMGGQRVYVGYAHQLVERAQVFSALAPDQAAANDPHAQPHIAQAHVYSLD